MSQTRSQKLNRDQCNETTITFRYVSVFGGDDSAIAVALTPAAMARLTNNRNAAQGAIMPSPALFGITVAFGLAAWGAVAWHYIWPALRERPSPENLQPILLLHAFRFLGLAFVVPGVVSSELPAAFAQPVAYGDLMTAILALLALATLRTRSGTGVTWVFNIFGTADLLFGFYQGSRISLPATPGLLGAAYFILAAYVPLLLITHGFAFRILLRTKVVAPTRNKLSTA